MQKVIFFLLAIGAAVASPSTPVKKCKGTNEELFKKVIVSTPKGVCTKLPCDIIIGEDLVADITFDVRHEVKQITTKANATVLGLTVEYDIPNADKGCDLLTNTACPIKPNTTAELTFKMNISKIFPKVSVNLVMFFIDQSQKMISCFEMPARVVSGK